MPSQTPDTDADWEHFARVDPYYAVLTDEAFRQKALTDDARSRFFQSGEGYVEYVVTTLQRLFGQHALKIALDFGCGVGRILFPLARRSTLAIGVDVSPTMLTECAHNAKQFSLGNVALFPGDPDLSAVSEYVGKIDLITSVLVLQHIPPARGVRLFARLVDLLAPGGRAAIQVTFASQLTNIAVESMTTTGIQYSFYQRISDSAMIRLGGEATPGVMQMNHYNLNEMLCLLYQHGIRSTFLQIAEHAGGIFGVELYFHKPTAPQF